MPGRRVTPPQRPSTLECATEGGLNEIVGLEPPETLRDHRRCTLGEEQIPGGVEVLKHLLGMDLQALRRLAVRGCRPAGEGQSVG